MVVSKQQLTRPLQTGDLVLYEIDQRVTRISAKVQNDSTTGGAAATLANEWMGQPVKVNSGVYEFAEDGDTIVGFVVTDNASEVLVADALTTRELAIITRGPALFNQDRLPTVDVYGVALVEATLTTAAEALGIEVKPISATTEEHTT